MPILDMTIIVVILVFIILLVWSQVQKQRMIDTVIEIKDMIKELKRD